MLLLLSLLARFFVFLILAHQLGHELVSFLCGVVPQVLAVLEDLNRSLVLQSLHDGEGSVTRLVALKNINFGVLDDVFEHFVVRAESGGQVQNIIASACFFDHVVCLLAEEDLDDAQVGLRAHKRKLERSVLIHLSPVWASFALLSVGTLHGFDVDEAGVDSLHEVLEQLLVAPVGSRTDHVRSDRVVTATAQADVAHLGELAARRNERLHHVDVTSAGRLDDEGCLPVILVTLRVALERRHLDGGRRQVHTPRDKRLHRLWLTAEDSCLKKVGSISGDIDMLNEVLDHGVDSHGDELAHCRSNVLRLHHVLEVLGLLAVGLAVVFIFDHVYARERFFSGKFGLF
mmetsp:Transcript_1659/g.2302  ORF Transcript_1659/g.2302 Transcript_1659/m.2302 type:complete len:345 (+) Transcript_1659:1872-2906(+)